MALDTSYILSSGSGVNNTASSSGTKGKKDLDMNDFLMLMVEQMKNQDIGNTMDTSQYINQLSQYTMIQAVSEMAEAVKNGFNSLQEMSLSTYSTSMIGKEATVAQENSSGELETITGTVEGVTFYEGSPMLIIEGNQYALKNVMSLSDPNSNTAKTLAEVAIEAARAAASAADSASDAADKATNAAQSGADAAEAIKDMVDAINSGESEASIVAAEAAAAQSIAENE